MKTKFLLLGLLLAVSICLMGASSSCGSAVHKSAVAADSIAQSLSAAEAINHQAWVSGQISAAERDQIGTYIRQATFANDAFIAQVRAAQAAGSPNLTSALASFQVLMANITTLNSQGVLHLKSADAQSLFSTTIAAINAQLAVIQTVIASK